MTKIDNLTNFADQQSDLILDDGSVASLNMVYNASTERWIANVFYNGKTYNGIGLCDHPNILRQWKNVLPFGLSVATSDQTDPFDINDFSSGRVGMFLLNSADVQQIENDIFTAP